MKTYTLNINSTYQDFRNFLNSYDYEDKNKHKNIIKIEDPSASNSENVLYSHRHLGNHNLEYKYFLNPNLDIYKTPNILMGNIYLNDDFVTFICASYHHKLLLRTYKESLFDFRFFICNLYRRYILSRSKILICIYSSLHHEDKVKQIKKSVWFNDFNRHANTKFFEVYGGAENTYSLGNKVFLSVDEDYKKLSLKTYKMIEYFNKYHDFDFLLKIDSSIIDRDSDVRQYTFSNFENNYRNKLFIRDYDGVLNVENHSFQYIQQWANSKNLKVEPEKIFGDEKIPDFWGGNAYVLSKKACGILSQNENYFLDFEKHMAGCEDLCVGYILRKNGVKNWN